MQHKGLENWRIKDFNRLRKEANNTGSFVYRGHKFYRTHGKHDDGKYHVCFIANLGNGHHLGITLDGILFKASVDKRGIAVHDVAMCLM